MQDDISACFAYHCNFDRHKLTLVYRHTYRYTKIHAGKGKCLEAIKYHKLYHVTSQNMCISSFQWTKLRDNIM